jgi:hypothetical protein
LRICRKFWSFRSSLIESRKSYENPCAICGNLLRSEEPGEMAPILRVKKNEITLIMSPKIPRVFTKENLA